MREKPLTLDGIALIGRTFDEYRRMFALDDINREKERLLDAASGISSFRGEAAARGYNVTACDPIYSLSADEIAGKSQDDIDRVMGMMPEAADLYKWDYFSDIEALKASRYAARNRFLTDFEQNGQSYIAEEFPLTNFDDGEFTTLLCSHFLFMYDEQLGYEFHRDVIYEMLRVCSKEIRIFPLVNLKGQRSPFVRRIVNEAFKRGYGITINKVDYEFVSGGNELLIIKK